MRVSHLSLVDFRNYHHADVAFRPGLNLIVGRNGQGKTNLIEAIGYVSTLSSHRNSQTSALIRSGEHSAIIRMNISSLDREILCEVQLNRAERNRAQLNKNPVQLREISKWISSVLFAPEDLLIVRGDPTARRKFIDEALVQLRPALAPTFSDYDRAAKQRSTLLRSAKHISRLQNVDSTLEVWDTKIAELGTEIMLARRQLIVDLQEPLKQAYQLIVKEDHHPSLAMSESLFSDATANEKEFVPGVDQSNAVDVSRETFNKIFLEKFQSLRQKELERGATLIGPHRDDVFFTLNGLPVKGYASHGESWSFVLSLKLAVAHLLRSVSSAGDPVIILDDVFAELDERRRNSLMSQVKTFEQVIVTAAVEADVPTGDWHTIRVNNGDAVVVS